MYQENWGDGVPRLSVFVRKGYTTSMELVRSVAVFIATVKLLNFVGAVILSAASNKLPLMFLNITEERQQGLEDLISAFSTLFLISQLVVILKCIICIYGYARSSTYYLAVYMMQLCVTVAYLTIYATVIVFRVHDKEYQNDFYESRDTNRKSQKAVNILEKKMNCCGTYNHPRPSCKPNQKACMASSANMYDYFLQTSWGSSVISTYLTFYLLSFLEIVLVALTIRYINKKRLNFNFSNNR